MLKSFIQVPEEFREHLGRNAEKWIAFARWLQDQTEAPTKKVYKADEASLHSMLKEKGPSALFQISTMLCPTKYRKQVLEAAYPYCLHEPSIYKRVLRSNRSSIHPRRGGAAYQTISRFTTLEGVMIVFDFAYSESRVHRVLWKDRLWKCQGLSNLEGVVKGLLMSWEDLPLRVNENGTLGKIVKQRLEEYSSRS